MKGFIELKRIAFRNLARHKVKTLLTCAAIMVSVALYIFMDGWIQGMSIESRRNIINYEMGAAKLQTKLYFDKKDELPSYENFANWETYAAVLDAAGYDAAPRFTFSGTLYSLTGSAPLIVHAVDPVAEARVLEYPSYIENGRYIQSGEFAIVLGAMTADKLKVGIPQRPTMAELDELIATAAMNATDEVFVRACYTTGEAESGAFQTSEQAASKVNRLLLKNPLPPVEQGRLWAIVAAAGRNDVRIATVIDIKMAPDAIRKDKWDAELWSLLSPEEQRLIGGAYEFDELTDAYLLANDEVAAPLDAILRAMVRVDFSGAIRHVNQLIDATVVGVVNSPDPATNSNIAYIPLDILQDEAGLMLDGHVTELLIRDKSMGAADMTSKRESKVAISAALTAGLAEQSLPEELGVFFWMDYVADYLGYEALESGSTRVLSYLLFILSFLGISNTMLMAILERTKETGMMRAMGMTDGQMVAVYMLEAGFLGLIGSALGVVIACVINYPMVEYGLDFSSMMDAMGGGVGYRVASNFRSTWNIPVIIGAGVVATLLSAAMAFVPTRRALKLPITESLMFE